MDKQFEILRKIRETFVQQLDSLTLEELNHIPKTHRNNIIWNIGHSLVSQQLLCYRLANLDTYLDKSLISKYKIGSVPEGNANQDEVDFIKTTLMESVDLLEEDYKKGKFQVYKEYTVGFGITLSSIEDAITFNNTHEGLHFGYLLALKKML